MIVYEERPFFKDRADAGRQLAEQLTVYEGKKAVIFAIPRGGVPVGFEVASRLKAALDIVIVRKIPVPGESEAGFGAITEDGTQVLNEQMVKYLNLGQAEIERESDLVRNEIMRRSLLYHRKLIPSPVKGKTAIIIDDGLASGYTMIAAIQSLKKRKAAEVVVAVPVASGAAYELVEPRADAIVCLIIAKTNMFAVAGFYENWYDMNDEEVNRYLETWRLKSAVAE